MNSFKNVLIAVLLTAAIALGVAVASRSDAPAPVLGAAAGTEHYNHETFAAGLTVGGGIRATSTDDTTATLLASDFDEERVIDFTPTVAGITLALPASSTLQSFAPKPGDTRVVFIRNATTTADTAVILAGGTGTLLKTASSTKSIYSDTDAGNYVRLDFVRKASTDLEVLMTPFVD